MKQRKPPFVLGGILVVALCAVVFIGIKSAKDAVPQSEEPPVSNANPDPVGAPREAPGKEAVADVVKAGPPKPEKVPMNRAGAAKGMMNEPDPDRFSVEIPKRSEQKPIKNPTSTSGQWW